MTLTPEQQNQVQQSKAAGETRVNLGFTAEQKAEWESVARHELAGKQENISQLKKMKAACLQPGFFGDVRRAITASRQPTDELASEIEVDARLLSKFRAGDAVLPAAALERLIGKLGLRLMQEIPR